MSDVTQTNCPICGSQATEQRPLSMLPSRDLKESIQYECIRCGCFSIDSLFEALAEPSGDGYLDGMGSRIRADLSAWLREKTDQRERYDGDIIKLDGSFLRDSTSNIIRNTFEAAIITRFHEKADRLLLAIERQTEHAGEDIEITIKDTDFVEWQARAWALNKDEFREIVHYLVVERRIAGGSGSHPVSAENLPAPNDFEPINLKILPAGWKRIEELEAAPRDSDQGFVAMWFNKKVNFLYDKALAPAIRAAGYNPLRIDRKPPIERLDDEIEAEIKKSRFVVADATGRRQSVFYEAGFARGLGIPVFWTYGGDNFEKLPFDTRQFYCFSWDKAELPELIDHLRWRIENVCGRGPV